jgi:hypothetical protein
MQFFTFGGFLIMNCWWPCEPETIDVIFNLNRYSCVDGTLIYVYIWYQHNGMDSERLT